MNVGVVKANVPKGTSRIKTAAKAATKKTLIAVLKPVVKVTKHKLFKPLSRIAMVAFLLFKVGSVAIDYGKEYAAFEKAKAAGHLDDDQVKNLKDIATFNADHRLLNCAPEESKPSCLATMYDEAAATLKEQKYKEVSDRLIDKMGEGLKKLKFKK